MERDSGLLLDVAAAFGIALAGGWLATRVRLPPMAGYIAAGLIISPFTPGFVGDIDRLRLLADIGVVLLLFAIGVQFRIVDILQQGWALVAGTIAATFTIIGAAFALALALGWSPEEAAYVGAACSISSSVVVVTVLERRGEIASAHGRMAIGFSVVQDLIAVVLIVMLEAATRDTAAGAGDALRDVAVAAGKAVGFVAVLLIVGVRVVPLVLGRVAEERSRELFFLAIAALVIGTALASDYIGLSLALGAFLAGIVVSESDLSHRVLGELLPIRDIFAVLFFVTAGMLVDPEAIIEEWPAVIGVLGLILCVKTAAVAGFFRLAGSPARSLMTAAVVVPAAEFTFLLAGAGLDGDVLSEDLFGAVIAGAVISIILAPASTAMVERLIRPTEALLVESPPTAPSRLGRLALICGYGAVGQTIAAVLQPRFDAIVIEEDQRLARLARERGLRVVEGSPTSPAILEHAEIEDARVVVVALDDPFATRLFTERARAINPHVDIIARAVVREEAERLRRSGIADAVIAEDEVAFELARHSLHRFGVSSREALAIIQQFRARARLTS
jgi:CPA2 family monovalent cation:H+ antiporter-2